MVTVYPVCCYRTMLPGVILQAPEPLLQLLSDKVLSLADWYGDPLDTGQADQWAKILQSRSRNSGSPVQARFRDQLAELVARYWSARDAEMSYRSLSAATDDHFEHALLELCYGQLLMARKLKVARKHLETGFSLAAHLLSPDDYFRVMKRHQILAVLPLSDDASERSGLDDLMKEAGVINKLVGSGVQRNRNVVHKRSDTLG